VEKLLNIQIKQHIDRIREQDAVHYALVFELDPRCSAPEFDKLKEDFQFHQFSEKEDKTSTKPYCDFRL